MAEYHRAIAMNGLPDSYDTIRQELERVLSAPNFRRAERSSALLRFVVEETLNGRADGLKEYTLGAQALGRGSDFDPRTDPSVRAEASRLRARLDQYYETAGAADPVIITLPKGSYIPQFLERQAEDGQAANPMASPGGTNKSRAMSYAVAAVLIACAFAAGYFVSRPDQAPADQPERQFDIALTSQGTLGGEVGPSFIFSPDGMRLVFVVSDASGVAHLHTRRLDREDDVELPGTEGARVPFFSPDGLWVGFWAAGKIKKISLEGGSPVVLCEAPDLLGASWGKDGQIIAALGGPQLVTFASDGGATRTLVDLSKDSENPRWPQIVSDGKVVVFTAMGSSGPNHANIEALTLKTGKRTVLFTGGTFGRLIGNSWLTYVNQGTLFAAPFNAKETAITSSPNPVLEGISYSPTFGYADLDASMSGDLVYRKYHQNQLVAKWVGPQETSRAPLTKPGAYLWPRLSHDGKRIAVQVMDSGEWKLAVIDLASGRSLHLPLPSEACFPLWTPGDRFLIAGCRRALFWVPSDGTGTAHVLMQLKDVLVPWSFSADGTRIAYHARGDSTGLDLWTMPVSITAAGISAGKPEPFLVSKAFEAYPTFSPDGRWIAYTSNETGNWVIYVRAFPDDHSAAVPVSNNDGRIPFWVPGESELLYRTDDQRLMAADYSIEHGAFVVRSVRPWSAARLADTGVLANLDLDPRTNRFLALRPSSSAEGQADDQVTFLLNFSEHLGRRLSTPSR